MSRPAHVNIESVEERAARECRERRDRVLAWPEIARDLTLQPLRFPTPEHWNGYVPPADWGGKRNDSSRRAALILILSAVKQAEDEGAA